jgi:hypothetical protein
MLGTKGLLPSEFHGRSGSHDSKFWSSRELHLLGSHGDIGKREDHTPDKEYDRQEGE